MDANIIGRLNSCRNEIGRYMKPRLNVIWNEIYCKRCNICVEVCPVGVLSLEMDEIVEKQGCIRCYQCERYCPDIAIEVMDEEEK